MIKKIGIAIAVITLNINLFAQTTKEAPDLDRNNGKKVYHVIGVQANELFRQLFSLGSSSDVNNPFLLKYSLGFTETNVEIMAGFGYSTFRNNQSGGFDTRDQQLSFRLGLAKKFEIGKRFETGIGLDVVNALDKSTSENTNENTFGSTTQTTVSTTEDKISSYGAGPQATMAFYINKKIKVGTELTGYFVYSENKFTSKVETTTKDNNSGFEQVDTNEDSSSSYNNAFTFTLPISLFLSIRF